MSAGDDTGHPHLATEVELIRDAIERGVPTLGICLGAQLIARALGAKVYPNPEKEIGWYDVTTSHAGRGDPLFAHFDPTEKIFQWHGDAFELPRGAVHLASTPTCRNQAFRYGESVYAFQFHLEVDEPLIERWLTVPVHLEELAALGGRVDPDAIRCDTRTHIRRLRQLSDRTFEEFASYLGVARRRSAHPHR